MNDPVVTQGALPENQGVVICGPLGDGPCVPNLREPLDEASYALQQAVGDFYVLIRHVESHNQIMAIWERLQELESLVNAACRAAGEKAETL